MKLSTVHCVSSERLDVTPVYQSTSSRGIGYINLNWDYMGHLALKSFFYYLFLFILPHHKYNENSKRKI